MMFALGIVDVLTEGQLERRRRDRRHRHDRGRRHGRPIGGIRQKLYGARDAGAEFFLAPEANCDEVVGHVPDGLQMIRTANLDESLAALEVISEDGDVDALPTCTAAATPAEGSRCADGTLGIPSEAGGTAPA